MSEQNLSTKPKPFVFVLMPFRSEFDDIYKFGIKGAAEDVDAYAERVDEQMYTEGILDRIYNQINKADVIVADMTGQNPNVFYEVGYAHALGKIVLLLTQRADDIPFDLKHRPHTVYEGRIDKLREDLTAKLRWAINEGRKEINSETLDVFEVFLAGRNLIEDADLKDSPTITIQIPPTGAFEEVVHFHVRNKSNKPTADISHVSLLTSPESLIAPWKTADRLYIPTYIEPIESLYVDPGGRLSRQYQLDIKIPILPPGAIEQFHLNLGSQGAPASGEWPFKLRFHSAARSYDFPFWILLEKRVDDKS